MFVYMYGIYRYFTKTLVCSASISHEMAIRVVKLLPCGDSSEDARLFGLVLYAREAGVYVFVEEWWWFDLKYEVVMRVRHYSAS